MSLTVMVTESTSWTTPAPAGRIAIAASSASAPPSASRTRRFRLRPMVRELLYRGGAAVSWPRRPDDDERAGSDDPGQMIAQPETPGVDRERRVDAAGARQDAAVADKKAFHPVDLAARADHARLRIGPGHHRAQGMGAAGETEKTVHPGQAHVQEAAGEVGGRHGVLGLRGRQAIEAVVGGRGA